MNRTFKLALGSVAVGILVLGLKYVAYRITGSVAFYADALESIVNVVAAAAALFAIHVGAKPADAGHPFGHAKAEYFSAVLEGVLIVVAAFSILHEAWQALSSPRVLDVPVAGMLVNGAATLLNAALAAILLRLGRRWRSVALIADGRHLIADVYTSIGAIVGLTLAVLSGWHILDPLIAGLVALNIIRTGASVIRESVGGLMDAAPAPEVVTQIRQVIEAEAAGVAGMHALRTRHAGHMTFVEFHLTVSGRMSVWASHAICDRIEDALEAAIDGVRVTIHVEPDERADDAGRPVFDAGKQADGGKQAAT
ncbi:MAG: cation transporter [Lautropia sp.]|nr:cation transporter [Lautropia sp.]